MAEHRIVNNDGTMLDFTCKNSTFKTNINKGFKHGAESTPRGSVFPEALIERDNESLWLEHVISTDGTELYWFMWYKKNGSPKIVVSGVFGKDELKNMIQKLTALAVRDELL